MPVNQGMMSSDKDDWGTPQDLFRRCDEIWHFDLDPASSDENALCDRHFTPEQNGLEQSWGGCSVFLNPPYGRQIGSWVKKAAMESQKPRTVVVALLPARTDTAWWQDWVVPYAAEIQFLRGRVRFCAEGKQLGSAPFPSALVRFGGELPRDARAH